MRTRVSFSQNISGKDENSVIRPLLFLLLALSGHAYSEELTPEAELTTAAPAIPQDAPAPVLKAVVVQGQRIEEKDSVLPLRAPTSVYGTSQSVLDTPRSVTEINAEQLSNDPINSSDDLVKYAPGIVRGGGQNAGIAPQFRGQGSEVFQDGQRGYGVRHPANLNSFEGADIVAGPSSVIYGSVTGSGGYINYLSKKPSFDKQHTKLSAQLGTWVPDGESRDSTRFVVDTTGPVNDTLAYRVSLTRQRSESYYDNVENNFDAFYGAIAWKPNDKLSVDFNAAWDDYFNWNITHGWNRPSQSLVDSGQYYAGRATPIIKNGSNYWSPVFASGAANSAVTGWVQRVRNAQGQYVTSGAPVSGSAAPYAGAGTIQGWVYDPTLPGNGLVSLSPQKSQRAEDENASLRKTAQLRVAYELSERSQLVNSTLYQGSEDTTDAVGSFQVQSSDEIIDNRTEFRYRIDGSLFDLAIADDSNTGFIYRKEHNKSLAANNSFLMINAYDLSLDPSSKSPQYLLGLTNLNAAGGNGSWIGTPGVAQTSSYFGLLSLAAMYPAGNELYAESVASYTSESEWSTQTLFTQHNLRFGDYVGLNIGGSGSWVHAAIQNPFPLPGANLRKDSDHYGLYAFQASPYVKPTSNSTVYFTYDRTQAINTGGFASGLSWGSGALANKLNPLAFESLSELFELGLKVEAIPNQLFFTLAAYDQARDTSPDQYNNIARLRVRGIESTVRFQPNEAWRSGLNLTRLSAYNEWTSQSGFAPRGFVPDNGTVFSDSNVLNALPSGRFDAVQIPEYSVSGYLDYRHSSGLGAELSGWWTSDWYLNLSRTVQIPNEFNLDLALYYRRPNWTTSIKVQNLSNELNFVSGLAGSTNTFLQPMPGRSVLGQIDYQF